MYKGIKGTVHKGVYGCASNTACTRNSSMVPFSCINTGMKGDNG